MLLRQPPENIRVPDGARMSRRIRLNQEKMVVQMVRQMSGERPEKCRELVVMDASSETQGVWWATSRDGREWLTLLTPHDCGTAGASDCVDVMVREINDQSDIPDDLRREHGLDA